MSEKQREMSNKSVMVSPTLVTLSLSKGDNVICHGDPFGKLRVTKIVSW
jgi:hypothetical protein